MENLRSSGLSFSGADHRDIEHYSLELITPIKLRIVTLQHICATRSTYLLLVGKMRLISTLGLLSDVREFG